MRRAALLALAFLFAGCGSQPAPEVPKAYLEDDVGDADPRYDIVRANFTELNGSIVLRMEIRNYADGLPVFDARIGTSLGEFYARLIVNETGRRPEIGRWLDDERVEAYEPCWIPSFPTDPDSPGPWLIYVELLNNRTGFERGGTIQSLVIATSQLDGSVRDEAEHESEFRAKGGANPYPEGACPINEERRNLP